MVNLENIITKYCINRICITLIKRIIRHGGNYNDKITSKFIIKSEFRNILKWCLTVKFCFQAHD